MSYWNMEKKAGEMYIGQCKDKAVPVQAWTGPEVSSRLRLPDFKTVSI